MTTNVLVLCAHNSARSVLSEGMLNHWAQRLDKNACAYSVGSTPSGRLNPSVLEALTNVDIDTAGYRSKGWNEFIAGGAPQMCVAIAVCDSAAAEQCPYWPGSPVKVYWGYVDPSDVPGGDEDKRQASEVIHQAIGYRML